MRQGLAVFRSTGAKLSLSVLLCELAWAYGRAGRPGEGATLLAEARVVMENTGERLYGAELYRLKGELTLGQLKIKGEAEACFQRAIKTARRRQAKSLELRAATSLARLWQSRDKRQQARRMLAEVYGWFTEGLDTADLREAKALLVELAA
jgi:predicted ATPase